jgi:uncharacterized membrane-anchored protein YhcB (DUF1043 family)
MSYLKPWSTLVVGIIIGYVVVPKVMARVGS